MATGSSEGEPPVTPKIVAGLIADGLEPLQATLTRMESLLLELSSGHRSSANVAKETARADIIAEARPHVGDSLENTAVKSRGVALKSKHLPHSMSSASMGPVEHTPSSRPWLHASETDNDQSPATRIPTHPLEEERPPQSLPDQRVAPSTDKGKEGDMSLSTPPALATDPRAMRAIEAKRSLDIRAIARGSTEEEAPAETSKLATFMKSCCIRVRDCALRALQFKEPRRHGRLNDLITSPIFENICAGVIIANSVFVAYTSDYEMKNPGKSHGSAVKGIERFFIAFYTIELLLRLLNHRLYFFINADCKWNLFDLFLVSMSLFDVVVSMITPSSGDSGGNVSFMRISRLLKLAKILRTLRVMKVFRDLAQILDSFKNCMISLFWSLIMMVFVIYIFALVFIQGLTSYILLGLESGQIEDHEEVLVMFGSMDASMLSLYMAVTGGNDWGAYFDVVAKAGGMYSMAFVFYMFFFAFALFNILTGVFVEKAVVSAQPDREEVILQQRRKTLEDASEFRHICHVLDTDNTGTITREEFAESMENELMVSYMSAVGLHVRDVELFFDLLLASRVTDVTADPADMSVSIDEFVESCMAMRGMATSFDVQRQRFTLQAMNRSFKEFEAKSFDKMEQINSDLLRMMSILRNAPDGTQKERHPERL